eukprot:6171827-Pleurochrysis_carterae.AAC.1
MLAQLEVGGLVKNLNKAIGHLVTRADEVHLDRAVELALAEVVLPAVVVFNYRYSGSKVVRDPIRSLRPYFLEPRTSELACTGYSESLSEATLVRATIGTGWEPLNQQYATITVMVERQFTSSAICYNYHNGRTSIFLYQTSPASRSELAQKPVCSRSSAAHASAGRGREESRRARSRTHAQRNNVYVMPDVENLPFCRTGSCSIESS